MESWEAPPSPHPDPAWANRLRTFGAETIFGASVNISEGFATILIGSWVPLAASGNIFEAWEHIKNTKSDFWDTLEPPLMAGEGSPTPFEIPCGSLHNILLDVRSGIEGYKGGVPTSVASGRPGPEQGYIYIYMNKV